MLTLLHSWLVGVARAASPDPASGSVQGSLPVGAPSVDAGTGAADLANRVLHTLTFIAYPLAFAGILYTAYVLFTAGGSPDGWTKAKKNISYMLVGFILIYGAAILIEALKSVLVVT